MQPEVAGRTVYYVNAPFDADEAEIRKFFERTGSVETVHPFMKRTSSDSRPKGAGLVIYAEVRGAEDAVADLDCMQLRDREIGVRRTRRVREPGVRGPPASGATAQEEA